MLSLVALESVYQITLLIATFGVMILSLEDITIRNVFSPSGIMSWEISRLLLGSDSKWKKWDFFLRFQNFKLGLYVRLLCSLTLFVMALFATTSVPVLFILFSLLVSMCVRSPYGQDGAYQMYVLVLFGMLSGCLFGQDSLLGKFSLWFIALNLVISYTIAGVAKLISPSWRSGEAMMGIFGCRTYCFSSLSNMLIKTPILSRFLCWSVILTETLFIFVFLLKWQLGIYLVLGGFLFHVGVAVFMGLNDFLFAFPAAYPALLYCTGFKFWEDFSLPF